MNNIKIISAVVALLGSTSVGNALAQSNTYGSPNQSTYNPSWYVAPSVNLTDADDRFGSFDKAKGVGLRFGKPINPSWDIQFGPTYSRSSSGPNRYQQGTLGIDGLYMFSRERFRPFLLIGGGAELDRVSTPFGHARDTSPYVNVGLGMQYSLSEQWGIQADLRRARSFMNGNDFAFNRANTNILTIGLTYAFDKRPTPAPVARVAPQPTPIAAAPEAAPPTPAAPTPPPAPRFERYTLSATELFAFDSAVLRMPQAKLDEIASALAGNAQVTNVIITGYTDRLGSEKYNMDLSQRRADSVKAYLTGKGIESGRLSSVAKGESNPVVQCTNKNHVELIKCLEPNRRVEVDQIVIERRVN